MSNRAIGYRSDREFYNKFLDLETSIIQAVITGSTTGENIFIELESKFLKYQKRNSWRGKENGEMEVTETEGERKYWVGQNVKCCKAITT